jgi:N-acetyltransferase
MTALSYDKTKLLSLFDKSHEMEDDGIRISPLTLNDMEQLAEHLLHEQSWQFHTKKLKALDRSGLEHHVRNLLQEKMMRKSFPFVAWEKKENPQPFAIVRYQNIDFQHIRLEIDEDLATFPYPIALMQQALKLMVDFAFHQLGVQRIGFCCHEGQQARIQLVQSLGAQEEGLIRSFYLMEKQAPANVVMLSLLQHEWPQ